MVQKLRAVRKQWRRGFLLIVSVAAILAQESTAQPRRRITLNVVAFDSSGQPVDDLKKEDFQVSDQGQRQDIVVFRRNAENDPGRLRNSRPPTRVVPPIVLLFDLLNDNLGNRGYGEEQIDRALEPLESSDSLYLYLLTRQGTIVPIRPVPNPGESVVVETTPWTRRIRPILSAALDRVYGLKQEGLDTVGTTLASIGALASSMRGIPGRKNIVWITHGLPYTYAAAGLLPLATRLDREGITLNSVDQGVDTTTGAIDTLDKFAELTGGKVYANDIKKAVLEVMSASHSGYVIQYAAPRLDGKYHKIRLTCARKGIRLQVKQGYYANP
jgi:VWFA-related protein